MKRKITLVIILVFLMMMSGGCISYLLQSRHITEGILIDGYTDDWNTSSLRYFENHGFSLGVGHDEAYFYILFRFKDMELARRVQMSGITFWLNREAVKDKSYGFQFTTITPRNALPPSSKIKKPFQNQVPMMLLPSGDFRAVLVENEEESMVYPLSGDYGAKGAFQMNNNIYSYEFRLPWDSSRVDFTTSQKYNFILGLEIGTRETNYAKRVEPSDGGRGGPGSPGGGPGIRGGPAGGRGEGPGSGPPGDRGFPGGMEKPKAIELWAKVKL